MLRMKRRSFLKLAAATGAAAALGPRLVGATLDREHPQGYSGDAPDSLDYTVVRSLCLACHGGCGIQVRVRNGEVIKIDGNPYHPNTYDYTAKGDLVVPGDLDAGPNGTDVGSVCPKGAAGLYTLYNPRRLLHPVKRVGKRGSRKWKRISWDDAYKEITEGGNLFGEGHVDGWKAILSDDPIGAAESDYMDEAPPDGYGPKRNQWLQMIGRDESKAMTKRLFKETGSKNKHGHTSICESTNKVAHEHMYKGCCPAVDWENATYVLCAGSNIYDASFPMQTQARYASKWFLRRAGTKLVYVGPRLQKAAGNHPQGEWVPIKPATDAGFGLGMIQYIINNKLYKADYISRPNQAAADAGGYMTYTDFTYLVSETEPKTYYEVDGKVQVSVNGVLTNADDATVADLEASIPGYKTVFTMLKERANEHTAEWYDEFCGLEKGTIARIASEFATADAPAVMQYKGPSQHTNGVWNCQGYWTVELLLDRWMRKGGHVTGGGSYHGHAHTAVKPPKSSGVKSDRAKSAYAGSKPTPTKPWYPLASHGNQVEAYAGMATGYPYKVKSIWFGGRCNSFLGMFRPQTVYKTHEVVPLIVMMDPFMNEQSMNSDYVLPDATYLQAFGSMHTHAAVLSKTDGIRVPVVGSYGKDNYYQPIEPDCRELSQICIDLGIKMGFPNFGKGGLGEHDLNNAWEFWNNVYEGKDYEGGLSGDNLELAGKYENPAKRTVGDYQNHAGTGLIHAYDSKRAAKKNSLTGKHFDGLPLARGVLDGAENPIPAGDYPYTIGTRKVVLHTQGRTAQNLVLMSMQPENPLDINPADAAKLGVQTGDWVKITGQSGDEMVCKVKVTSTVRPGYVEEEHGWGHWELGARDIEIEGHENGGIKGDPRVGAGFRYNEVCQADPAQTGDPDTIGCPTDPIGAGNQTYGYSVKIEKV